MTLPIQPGQLIATLRRGAAEVEQAVQTTADKLGTIAAHASPVEAGRALRALGSRTAADIGDIPQFKQAREGIEHGANGLADFVGWLSGPEGPSFEDLTAKVPGLQRGIGDVIDAAMRNPVVKGAVGRAFGFEYVPGGDFYTTNEHSLQSHLGFHDLYDTAGKLLGMDLDDKVMEFESGGTQYRVELWKGGYGNGGAFGGEIGLYTRGTGERGLLGNLLEKIPGYYSSANGRDQVRMTNEIYDKRTGQTYFRNDGAGADDGKHYWNLAIRTDPGVRHEDIGQRGTIEMNSPDAARKLADEINRQGAQMAQAGEDGKLTATVDGNTVRFVWE